MSVHPDTHDDRVIVLAPTPRDAEVTIALLTEAGLQACACATLDLAVAEARRGAAAFLLAEEALHADGRRQVAALVEAQPAWSDLPLLVLTYAGADSAAAREATTTLGNVTLLERPLRVGTLISAARTAFRARQRQYQIREHLAERARVEAALRRDEERQAFLLKLTDALRPIAKAVDVEAVATRMLCEQLGTVGAHYRELDPAEMSPFGVDVYQALAAGRTLVVADAAADPRLRPTRLCPEDAASIRAYVAVPLLQAARVAAVLCASRADAHEWTRAEIAMLEESAQRTWAEIQRARAEEALAEAETTFRAELEGRVRERTAALALANASLEDEVRERRAAERQIQALFERLVSVQEDERRRIARDLHDQLGQQMTALRMRLDLVLPWLAGDPAREEHARQTRRLAEDVDRNIDFLIWELRPAALEQLGLPAALRNLVTSWSERFGIEASFKGTRTRHLRLPADTEANLYRLVQEALHNVAKHARARHVGVRLQGRDRGIVLAVQDDGQGFDPSAVQRNPSAGLGLTSMRERAMLVGGDLRIDTSPGKGTLVVVTVPSRPEPDADSR